jgi:copper chaperone
MKQELTLSGMSCGHCVKAVQEALESREDLEVESVNIGSAVITTPDYPSIEASLKDLLEEEGYPIQSVRAL